MARTNLISNPDDLGRFAERWGDLYERSGCRLPFLHLSWIQTWWRVFGRSTRFVSNELRILAIEQEDHLVGALPLYCTTYGLGPTLGFNYVRPVGSDANLTEIRTPLILPGEESATVAAAAQFFADESRAWDLVNWSSFPGGLPGAAQLPGRPISHNHAAVEMFLLHLPESWEQFVAPLSRNTKEAIRKAHNALKRDGLSAELEVLERPDEILPLLPRFFELHARRAELPDVVTHPNVFGPERHRTFLTGIVQTMGSQGLLRLFVLKVRGEIVALRLGFVIKDSLYFYYSGFDPAFAKYSVMTRLVIEMIKWALLSGVATINLSSGRDGSKTRWNPEVVRYEHYAHVGSRWRSRAALAAVDRFGDPGKWWNQGMTRTLVGGAGACGAVPNVIGPVW